MTPPIRIDIVSDVVCPWCIVGYRQLSQALDQTGIAADLHWHPFELNHDMVPEGENLRDHIMRKYGSSAEDSAQSRARLVDIGADLGIAFCFDDDSRIYNTFRAHNLIHWAREQGRSHDMKQALFQAYFTDQVDVSDMTALADVAEKAGFDRAEALRILTDLPQADAVRREEQHWIQQGIQGVPAMVFDGKYLVTGAQGADTYGQILNRVLELRAA
ncbi:MAG: DsbA family oxidoreductase [Marinibacterium sp.]|nr:DsbA family oxidoreductase [Marinibacterium sp.]